jgi:hypothetical protein
MKRLTLEQFNTLLDQTAIKPKLKREVRFAASTDSLSDEAFANSELLVVADRSGNRGVLLMGLGDDFYLVGYELSRGIVSKSGAAQPIICDFCRTWQTGSRSGSVLLSKDRSAKTNGFLCCADLLCSQHVRSLTSAARTSRAQLREDLNDEQRVERLRARLEEVVKRLELPKLTLQ